MKIVHDVVSNLRKHRHPRTPHSTPPCSTQAPFLGVLSAMRDSSLPLTVHEFDEWGDPNSSAEVEAMIRSYCPYENVVEQEYPALLVTASLNDNRCGPHREQRKEGGGRGRSFQSTPL